jgi:DNA-binding HxlR family transcriptional regulator
MREHPVRLSELQRMIPSASKKAITASLRSLQSIQVISRTDFSDAILHVEYEITDPMRDRIDSLLDYLADWSSSLPEVDR